MPSYSFYTLGGMRKATLTAATEATGYPDDNLLDLNPDTIWKPTSSANEDIVIDLHQSDTQQVDAFGFFCKNPGVTLGAALSSIALMWSTDGINYNYVSGGTIEPENISAGDYIQITDAGGNYRIWKFKITNMSAVIEMSMLWLFRKRTITMATQSPANDIDVSYNKGYKSSDGRSIIRGLNTQRGKIFRLTYLLGETDWTTLQGVHADCHGRRFPLILDDGTTKTLVRFTSDRLNPNQLDYQYYNPTVELEALPFIPEGEVY